MHYKDYLILDFLFFALNFQATFFKWDNSCIVFYFLISHILLVRKKDKCLFCITKTYNK